MFSFLHHNIINAKKCVGAAKRAPLLRTLSVRLHGGDMKHFVGTALQNFTLQTYANSWWPPFLRRAWQGIKLKDRNGNPAAATATAKLTYASKNNRWRR
jgi:hypothetical protein